MERYLGEKIPKLGFGLMRLPQKDGQIDLEQTKAMVDRFLEEGFAILTPRTDTGTGLRNRQLKPRW